MASKLSRDLEQDSFNWLSISTMYSHNRLLTEAYYGDNDQEHVEKRKEAANLDRLSCQNV
jgi:hypothetical protein